jgi:hypothetical protein
MTVKILTLAQTILAVRRLGVSQILAVNYLVVDEVRCAYHILLVGPTSWGAMACYSESSFLLMTHSRIRVHDAERGGVAGGRRSGKGGDPEKSSVISILVISLNFCKNFQLTLSVIKNISLQTSRATISKSPILIMLLISLSFNQAIIPLSKYHCLCFNTSVFNWTFLSVTLLKKNPIAQKYIL